MPFESVVAVPVVRPEPDPDAVARVARLLVEAERPVLLAGSDLYWDEGETALSIASMRRSAPSTFSNRRTSS